MIGRLFPTGMERQLAIYLAGLEGRKPSLPVAYEALRDRAREAMFPEAYGYLAAARAVEIRCARTARRSAGEGSCHAT